MLSVRPETEDRIAAIRRINEAAFGRPAEGALVDALRRGDSFIPELSLVAEQDGEPVGHILFSRIQIRSGDAAHEAVALAPMAVLPAYQNRGIGSHLVRHGLAACERLGQKVVVVLGHPDFYPRFGFQPASLYGITPPFPVPDEVFMVYSADKARLREVSGVVVYPPAFDAV